MAVGAGARCLPWLPAAGEQEFTRVAPAARFGGGGLAGWGQPAVARSALSFVNTASSSPVHGYVAWTCSFARRAENASRAATCSSR